MMDAATPVCQSIQVEDQTIEKQCKCISCEQNSSDDSDDTDSRKCFLSFFATYSPADKQEDQSCLRCQMATTTTE